MSVTSAAGPSTSAVEAIKEKARRLSVLSMMATTAAGSGHPTSCMSAAELVAGTFFYAMKFDPKNPNSPDADRFVLSKGHAAPVLYAALRRGRRVPRVALDDAAPILERTRRPPDAAHSRCRRGDRLAGPGSVGGCRTRDRAARSIRSRRASMSCWAMAKWRKARFGKPPNLPGHYKLDNLTVLADVNALGQSEPTMYRHDMDVYRKKFESQGFATEVIDGHDVTAVLTALDRARATKGRPQAIIARTDQRPRRRLRCRKANIGTAKLFPRTNWRKP